MIIVQKSDFKGFHQISQNCYEDESLESYIDLYEEKFLCQLLGDDLSDAFIADLVNGVPQSAIYLDIYNAFCITQTNSCTCEPEILDSYGIKDMLLSMLYYQFVSDQPYQNTITGNVKSQNSKASVLSTADLSRSVEKRWNQGVQSYRAIQAFILDANENSDPDTYTDFEGIPIKPKFLDLL